MTSGVALSVGDGGERDTPAIAPAGVLGEKAGEELDEVAVACAGKDAEAFEQREFHLVMIEDVALAHSPREGEGLIAQTGRKIHRFVAETVGVGEQDA